MQQVLRSYTRRASKHCRDERERTVRKYAPMVYKVVRQFADRSGAAVDAEQLFSAGMIGLLDAVAKYDEKRGIAFECYAKIRIKGAVLDELRSADHLSRGMRRRSRFVQDYQDRVELLEGETASDDQIAEATGLSVEEVQASRTRRAPPEVIDPAILDTIARSNVWQPMTPSALDVVAWKQNVQLVAEALEKLPERNRMVLGLYYEQELTLQEIGDIIGVTESRVSQIRRETIEMLRQHVCRSSERRVDIRSSRAE